MFIKPTRSGGHTYLQLVESYRNDAGQPRQRTVASLGRLDEVGGGVDSLLAGLLRAKGFDLARRTVAKYREAIGLGSSVQRRRQKALAAVR